MIRRQIRMSILALLLGMNSNGQPQIQVTSSNNIVSNTMASDPIAHTNRLAREKSPYLLQHQHNPVDWFAWGDEAFNKARAEQKPVFLSIGYSTCHWCHVMERESFESKEVADYLNAHFVSIKVDREERPDVDRIYMTFVQSTTGQGGWPLNCFLTSDLKPFYGGTYFPPESKYGRPSFLDLLRQIQNLWETRKSDLSKSADELHVRMEQMTSHGPAKEELEIQSTIESAAKSFKDSYDPVHGGFGSAPKFPQPSQPQFLLQYAVKNHDSEAVQMVLKTCRQMALGGIHDQLGGGFARYSVDEQWLVPHFEKMLYDNAQLLDLYLDAYLASGDEAHAQTARSIIDYVLRDMTHAEGGFFSAEDADSEGKEGKFYCWTLSELSNLLTPEEFNVARSHFGITSKGNFVDHSDPHPLPHQNVLSVAQTNLSAQDVLLLKSARSKMFTARSHRIRPHLDDKILASWNGQMLGALSRAYAVLGDMSYLAAAEKNVAFIKSKLWDASSGTLYHRWREGERDSVQLQQAYAYELAGVLELYQATLKPKHLEFAISLADSMIQKFEDIHSGGFWQSGSDSKDLILRVKEDYDGAEPSGNSVAAMALLKLGKITGKAGYGESGLKAIHLYSQRLHSFPQAMPYLLQALQFSSHEPIRVVIAGTPTDVTTQKLVHQANGVYQPFKVILGNQGPVDAFALETAKTNGSAAFICTGNTCQAPTSDPQVIRKFLSAFD